MFLFTDMYKKYLYEYNKLDINKNKNIRSNEVQNGNQYIIKGGTPLKGEVTIGGAKNAALGILAAAIMTDETVTIDNLPDVRDINVLLQAIEGIGATVERIDAHTVRINGSTIGNITIDYDSIRKIRASYYLLGALLGKYKKHRLLFREAVTSEAVLSTSI